MASIQCFAPAKINLFLHVTGRRSDGYHTLQTAFLLLNYGDEIRLSLRDDGRIVRLSDLKDVPPDKDLVVRAARLLQEKTGCQQGVDITLTKYLPMGGGLGGGSSDAASVLLGLNKLWQLDLSRALLQKWALVLGADVPFFIFGESALAQGVGEALKPLDIEKGWYVVVEPPVAVSTADIFSAKELTRDTKSIIISPSVIPAQIMSRSRNDLEPVVCRRYPQVARALSVLSQFGVARMSGSGACVFLACHQQEEAQAVAEKLRALLPWRIWVAESLSKHPLWSFSQK